MRNVFLYLFVSIIVACVAVKQEGKEGDIFRAVLVHSILLALIVAAIVTLYAYVFPGVVPSGHQFLISGVPK